MSDSRVTILLLDGVGCGELPDAADYSDQGSNTLANLAKAVGGLNLPTLAALGLGNITPIQGVPAQAHARASFGRMAEQSAGKDSTAGHWEVAGLVTDKPFPLFPNGFPAELIHSFEQAIGRKTLGNVAASGTEIIKELGEEHIKTGCPIVYTSADSVLQVACHEDVIPPDELYRICQEARGLCAGPFCVGRVIARPFTGKPGSFKRTARRKDFSCAPPLPTLLDNVKEASLPVVAIGKVDDLFAGRGFTETHHSVSNADCLRLTVEAMEKTRTGLIFANLIQFDMDWGHRNDTAGFAAGLAEFDVFLPNILNHLDRHDLLFITADHGNDPTTPSTDHSREYVPLLALGPAFREGVDLGIRSTFADLGQTAAEFLKVKPTPHGTSFLELIR
ncbi:MAG: phosphopentomutase [candidate division WOR-3 bacterium]|nr:phosphopentomutase [candidate division WOR-3 bacterium]